MQAPLDVFDTNHEGSLDSGDAKDAILRMGVVSDPGPRQMRMKANLLNLGLWGIIVVLSLALFTVFQNPGQRSVSQDISFSQLLNDVDQGKVRSVVIQGSEIHGTYTDGRRFNIYAPNDPTHVD